jgi:hypothetical protein
MADARWGHEIGTYLLGELARLLEEARRKLDSGELRGERRRLTEAFAKKAEVLLRTSRFSQ